MVHNNSTEVFTNEEMFQIVTWHITGVSTAQIMRLFKHMFQNRPVLTARVVDRIVGNLRDHGCFSRRKKECRPRPVNPENSSRSGISNQRVGTTLNKNGCVTDYKLKLRGKSLDTEETADTIKTEQTQESDYESHDSIEQQISPMEENETENIKNIDVSNIKVEDDIVNEDHLNQSQMVFTNEEMFQIMTWRINGLYTAKIIRMFKQMFQNRPVPTQSIIERIMQDLREHGRFSRARKYVPPKIKKSRNPEKELRAIRICAAKEKNATRSVRNLAKEFGISPATVAQILKDGGFTLSRKSWGKNETKGQVKSGSQLKNINIEESNEQVNDTEETFPTITTEQMQEIDFDAHDSIEQRISPIEENGFTKSQNKIIDVQVKTEHHFENIYIEDFNEQHAAIKKEVDDTEVTFETLTTEQIMQVRDDDNHEGSIIEQQRSLMEENVFIKSEDILENSNVESNTSQFDVDIKKEELNTKDEDDIVNEDHLNQRLSNFSIPVVGVGFNEANSSNLPKCGILTIMDYFNKNNNSINTEIMSLTSEISGKQNYGDNAVGCVQVKHEPSLCEIKASVTSDYDTNANSYDVSCIINTTANIIIETKCHKCPARKGGCVHCVAFLMWLHRRSEDPPGEEVTSYWR